jgi:hypothetical protein
MPNELFNDDWVNEWHVIPLEEQERIARDLAKRMQEEHIRMFGSCTVVCLRSKEE